MFFSQTVEYALRAVAALAERAPEPMTTEQIATVTRVPQAYLSKVLQAMGRGGVVRSQRGIGGGFTLARPTDEVTLLDVVNAVDPIQRIEECPLGLAAHGVNLCPLHSRLDEALASVEKVFASTTLAEMLAAPRKQACKFPRVRA